MSESDTYHVYPIDDLTEHDTSDNGDCPCGPETQAVERDDGSMSWVLTHHALDGREHDEEGHDKSECPSCRAAAAGVNS